MLLENQVSISMSQTEKNNVTFKYTNISFTSQRKFQVVQLQLYYYIDNEQ